MHSIDAYVQCTQKPEDIENVELLGNEQAERYRALTARANYSGLDRTDICFASETW